MSEEVKEKVEKPEVEETEVIETPVEAQEDKPKEDELENYTKGVKKRINKLTEKYRQEEREKEEAVRVSQQLLAENRKLKGQVKNLDTGYVAEYGSRLQSQEEQAKQIYKQAYEAGDTDKMIEAQQALSAVAVEKQKYHTAKVRVEQQQAYLKQQQQQQQQPSAAAPQQQQQPASKPDPRAEKWAEKNDWFGEDQIMTSAAFVIDRQVKEEGFDVTTEEYYNEIDRRIKAEFPHKFEVTKKSNGSSQVASAGNSASKSTTQRRKTVRLTPSQVAIAKKLVVSQQDYAKQMLAIEEREGK